MKTGIEEISDVDGDGVGEENFKQRSRRNIRRCAIEIVFR